MFPFESHELCALSAVAVSLYRGAFINWNALVLVNINLWIMWVGESGAIVLNQMKKKKKD